jgi:hypothetical protein
MYVHYLEQKTNLTPEEKGNSCFGAIHHGHSLLLAIPDT